jgi:hypothetical protein
MNLLAAILISGFASFTFHASSHAANAHDVAISVTLGYDMQCGYPGAEPLVITFPRALPPVARAAVLVDGKPARAVSVHGRTLTVQMRRKPQVLCDVIARGTLKVVVTKAAHLANPATPGSYRITAAKAEMLAAARFAVR